MGKTGSTTWPTLVGERQPDFRAEQRVETPEILVVAVCRRRAVVRDQRREAQRQTEHLFQALLGRAFRGEV